MFNQISRICVTAKKPSHHEQTFFLQFSLFFPRASVSSLLNKESMVGILYDRKQVITSQKQIQIKQAWHQEKILIDAKKQKIRIL